MCLGSSGSVDVETPAQAVSVLTEEPSQVEIDSPKIQEAQKKNKAQLKKTGATGLNTSKSGSGLSM